MTTCLGDIQCLLSTSLYEEEGSTHQDTADTYQGSWDENRIQYQLCDLNTDDEDNPLNSNFVFPYSYQNSC